MASLGATRGRGVVRKVWHWVRWPLAILVVAYIGLVLYRIPAVGEKERSDKAVAAIHAQKLTLDDVMGKNLPPMPDATQNNSTVAGIDANHNGIRDDVELAIFKKYPNSARIRAAELQYALDLQTYITAVFNTDTWLAAAIEEDRGYQCIGETYPRTNLDVYNQITDSRTSEVEKMEFNTVERGKAKEQSANFTTSWALPDKDFCDLDLSTLSN